MTHLPFDAKVEFGKYDGGFEVGQGVEVFYRGGVGQRDRKVRRTITRVTATQIALNDGERFMKSTGVRVAARARCEQPDTLTYVYA